MNQLKPISQVLDKELYSQIDAIKEGIIDTWHTAQIFRTKTEARYSVLNDLKFPTNDGKYWQSKREQKVHFDELTTLSFEIKRKKIDLREIEEKLETAEGYDKERLEIDRDECIFYIASGMRVAKDRVREVVMWEEFKKEFNDGTLDTQNPNTHQAVSLFRQVLHRAQVAPKDISAEERLSIDGILHGLKDLPENKKIIEKLIESGKAK